MACLLSLETFKSKDYLQHNKIFIMKRYMYDFIITFFYKENHFIVCNQVIKQCQQKGVRFCYYFSYVTFYRRNPSLQSCELMENHDLERSVQSLRYVHVQGYDMYTSQQKRRRQIRYMNKVHYCFNISPLCTII